MNVTGEDLLFAGAVTAMAVALWCVKHFAPPSVALHQWAKEQGFKILRARYSEFALGPFEPDGSRKLQDVFQVILRTPDGVKREAWVRCSRAPGAEKVEVVWGAVSSKSTAGMQSESPG